MRAVMLLPCLALLVCVRAAVTGPEARSSSTNPKDQQLATASVGVLDSVLRGKSRQSRCVRCYEDRDRDRYYGGYSSRTGDDMRSSAWYYSGYDDRSSSSRGGDRDYDRYYDRYRNYYDDLYSPRTYDRYEGRGYDDYRRGSYGGAGSYDRDRGYGYDNRERDRYYGDRYSEGSSRDRYYDRSRSNYDRYDPYDRYYSRYDFRNYRPWDETYRGQSGFDNSGRGYYFVGDAEDDSDTGRNRGYGGGYSYNRPSPALNSPCGSRLLGSNCPYSGGGSKVTSSAIGSDSSRVGGHTSVMGSDGGPGSWTYLGDQDKNGGGGSSSGSSSSGSSSGSNGGSGSGGSRERERDRERDAQSSSYGGRPRPLGVSYLLERDSDAASDGPGNTANPAGNGGSGGVGGAGSVGQSMPVPAAQTAAEGSTGKAAEQ
ncbi:keratin, type I cytoskeletal 9 isoform X3 [Drosophila kikkawai]|uniref:Keratin, type I cytoskeletal 9 isoform X3 n=1 Tax=Drosophila kikkawai TaxID=30033 RepID=A0A6P4J855_DROKI|nr:RNA-binding motif protein, X-linked-like-3 isoform X1 [Drosophila kikkawai]